MNIPLSTEQGHRDADAVRADAILDQRAHAALGIDRVGDKSEDEAEQEGRLENSRPEKEYPRGSQKIEDQSCVHGSESKL